MQHKDAATLYKVLSDETRLKILNMLAEDGLCACKIQEAFCITQPTLSYHMKLLIESGLVVGVKDGIWMRYSLVRDRLHDAGRFLTALSEAKEPAAELIPDCCSFSYKRGRRT